MSSSFLWPYNKIFQEPFFGHHYLHCPRFPNQTQLTFLCGLTLLFHSPSHPSQFYSIPSFPLAQFHPLPRLNYLPTLKSNPYPARLNSFYPSSCRLTFSWCNTIYKKRSWCADFAILIFKHACVYSNIIDSSTKYPECIFLRYQNSLRLLNRFRILEPR